MAKCSISRPLIGPFDYHIYIGSSLEFYYKTFYIKDRFSELGLSVKLKYEVSDSNETALKNVREGIAKSFRCLLFVNDAYMDDLFFNEEKSRLLQKCKMFTDKSVLILISKTMKDVDGAKKLFEDFEQVVVSDEELTRDEFYKDLTDSVIEADTNLNLIHLPRENFGQEAAYGYFYGFLRLVLPDLSSKSLEGFERIKEKIIPKMLIIIPEDCVCRLTLNIDNKLETTELFLTTIANRAGTLERNYKSSIHKILDENGNDYYFVGEFAAPLLSMYETYIFGLSGITLEELYQERNVFFMTLKSILNHEMNTKMKDKYRLLFWRNVNLNHVNLDTSLYDLLLAAVKEEIASNCSVLEEDSCKNDEPLTTHTQKLRIEGSFSKGACKDLVNYKLFQPIRGKCLTFIFNECLDEPGSRSGCEHDEKYIVEIFEKLRFEVEVYKDQTNSELEKILLKYQNMDHSSYGAFVCCISSHGRHGNIVTKDGLMPILKITDFFSETACPTLKEKPKMFFIQCCQKDDPNIKEKILEPDQCDENANKLHSMMKSFLNLPEIDNSNPLLSSKLAALIQDKSTEEMTQIIRYESLIKSALTPCHPNFLMSYSCLPSKVSYRTGNTGSIYFRALKKCLVENVDVTLCLVNLTREVNAILKSFQKKTGKSNASQEPFFVSSGLKKLIFFN